MSTIAVTRKDGFVAIAADTMSTWDAGKDTAKYVVNHGKIIEVGGTYIAVCGATSLKLILTDYFSSQKAVLRLCSVEEIFGVWKGLHVSLKDKYFLNPTEDEDDSFESSRMDVLIANEHGIFGVSAHRAIQEYSSFYAYGSGREYALGAMYTAFSADGTTAEAIARLGIETAAEFDRSTGLPASVVTIPLRVAGCLPPAPKRKRAGEPPRGRTQR